MIKGLLARAPQAPRALVQLALASLALAPSTLATPAASAATPPIKHVFVIVLENKGFDGTFGIYSPAQYLAWTLPSMGAFVPNYYGVTHQSLPNYIAMVSGQGANPATQSDCQFYSDVTPGLLDSSGQAMGAGCVYPAAVKTIADQLTAAHLSWKGYMEDMGNGGSGVAQTCRHPALYSQDSTQSARKGDQYAARHNPFVYFHSIIDSPACAADDVPLDRLSADLGSAASTPNFSFITPNLCDDGHDAPCVDGRPGGLRSTDVFLRAWVPKILASPAYRADGMLVITFDESDGSDASSCCGEQQFPNTPNNGGPYPGLGGGHTGALVLSPFIEPGTVDGQPYNHFSLLRSIEDVFGLGHLGYAGQAGLPSFGADLFTCYQPSGPPIQSARIGQGPSGPQLLELKLWRLGKVVVTVKPQARKSRSRMLRIGPTLGPCQLAKAPLPGAHGTVTVKAYSLGGFERRTLTY